MPISLVVLAAGFSTRYGSSKQMEVLGPNGETIPLYSVIDAIKIGFSEVIFVIRREQIEFQDYMNLHLKGKIKVSYVYQDVDDIPKAYHREKPWGTGHAVYVLRKILKSPFCVINADDYYGFKALEEMYFFLKHSCNEVNYALLGYPIRKTLPEVGSVNRGLCQVENGVLKGIKEALQITWDTKQIYYNHQVIGEDTICSMGCFAFHPSIFQILEEKLIEFLEKNPKENDEFFLTDVLNEILDKIDVSVILSPSKWVGLTNKNDLSWVKENLNIEKN